MPISQNTIIKTANVKKKKKAKTQYSSIDRGEIFSAMELWSTIKVKCFIHFMKKVLKELKI